MILCVTLLLAAEAILGDDRTALIAHMKGLGRMIELNGGEDFLSPAVATQVRLADLKAALVRQSRPSFKLPPFLRRRVAMAISTPSSIQDPALSTLGSGFQSPPLSLHIASDLHQCIRYMHHLSSITEQSHTDKRPCCEYGIDDFSALDHSLISLSFKCRLSNLEECIRITLLLYSNTALWKTPLYFNWIIALVAELKTALIATDWQLVAAEHTELFLWVVLMGRYAASADVEEVIAWWDLKLRFVVSVLGLHEWEHAKLIVKAFFYLEQTYGRAWEGIWNSIVLGLGDELQQPEQHPAKHPCSC
ncbi:hypothetical protein MMC08_008675 [Hypocenomyce scalaris]|nr:hypothetical protein [Hypocenomyce scalaris]